MSDYELMVIGAGPGGYVAALRAAKLGLKTAIVENRDVGGTCLNRGCIPTKTLLHSAEVAREAQEAQALGVTAQATVDFAAAHHRKAQVTQQLREGIEGLFRQQKVDLIRGTGTILAPDQVEVEGKIYSADKILIATGSVPARPPIPGLEHALTSDELLEHQDQVCKSLVIIGGGVIGMEFASLYQMLGCRVTVLEAMDRILPNMDREVCQNLSMILKKRGVQIFAGARVEQVEKAEEGYTVRFTQKGQSAQVQGEVVLCAIGRPSQHPGAVRPGLLRGTGARPHPGGRELPDQRARRVRCGRRVRPHPAGPCGLRPGNRLRGAPGWEQSPDQSERRPLLHLH